MARTSVRARGMEFSREVGLGLELGLGHLLPLRAWATKRSKAGGGARSPMAVGGMHPSPRPWTASRPKLKGRGCPGCPAVPTPRLTPSSTGSTMHASGCQDSVTGAPIAGCSAPNPSCSACVTRSTVPSFDTHAVGQRLPGVRTFHHHAGQPIRRIGAPDAQPFRTQRQQRRPGHGRCRGAHGDPKVRQQQFVMPHDRPAGCSPRRGTRRRTGCSGRS